MRIAIIGPAGSGKSTLVKKIEQSQYVLRNEHGTHDFLCISCDEVINNIYEHGDPDCEIIKFIRKICPRSVRIENCEPTEIKAAYVNKNILGSFILKNKKERTKLENLAFNVIVEKINHFSWKDDIIVDGILPRFINRMKFDYVLYVCTDEKERTRRLKKRGVSPKRIKEIQSVQKKMFKDFMISLT